MAALPPRLAALHGFIVGRALPLWATAGVDASAAFHEQLQLDGRPDPESVRRMRGQARQIYVYAHATLLGLYDGAALAVAAFDRMIADYWQADGGFSLSVGPDGAPHDRRRTAYDQAFGLLSMAWLHRLTGSAVYADWAARTLAFMDTTLADPAGGYADHVGATTHCQNPHMHLLEALLAWFEATGDARFLVRADAVHALFATRFLDRSVPVLREFFNARWTLDPVRGDHVDPGHHLEWVWLLDRYRRYRPDAADETPALLVAARRGIDPRDGLVMDEMHADGRILRGTKRMWPQTEHLKAQVVLFERDPARGADGIDRVCGLLMDHYLDPATGTWNDQVGGDGRRLSTVSPASSFYHLFLAYTEAMRVAGAPSPVEAGRAGLSPRCRTG